MVICTTFFKSHFFIRQWMSQLIRQLEINRRINSLFIGRSKSVRFLMIIGKRISRVSLYPISTFDWRLKQIEKAFIFHLHNYQLVISISFDDWRVNWNFSRDFLSLHLVPEALSTADRQLPLRAQMFLFMQMRLRQFYRDNETCRILRWFMDTGYGFIESPYMKADGDFMTSTELKKMDRSPVDQATSANILSKK